jgi:hypothetical protein
MVVVLRVVRQVGVERVESVAAGVNGLRTRASS